MTLTTPAQSADPGLLAANERFELRRSPASLLRRRRITRILKRAGAPDAEQLAAALNEALGARIALGADRAFNPGAVTEILMGAWDAPQRGACADLRCYELKAQGARSRVPLGGIGSFAEYAVAPEKLAGLLRDSHSAIDAPGRELRLSRSATHLRLSRCGRELARWSWEDLHAWSTRKLPGLVLAHWRRNERAAWMSRAEVLWSPPRDADGLRAWAAENPLILRFNHRGGARFTMETTRPRLRRFFAERLSISAQELRRPGARLLARAANENGS